MFQIVHIVETLVDGLNWYNVDMKKVDRFLIIVIIVLS